MAGHKISVKQITRREWGDVLGDKPSPMMTDLEQESVLVSEGYAVVPAGPGLGIELDEEAVTRYTVES